MADCGEKSANERGDIAIFAEDLFCAVERLFFEEEIFSVLMEERSTDPREKIIVDICAEHGADEP